jgi:hypothetical protein
MYLTTHGQVVNETVSNRQKNAWRNLASDGGVMADPPDL